MQTVFVMKKNFVAGFVFIYTHIKNFGWQREIFFTNFKLNLANQFKLFLYQTPEDKSLLGHREYFMKTWVKCIAQRM